MYFQGNTSFLFIQDKPLQVQHYKPIFILPVFTCLQSACWGNPEVFKENHQEAHLAPSHFLGKLTWANVHAGMEPLYERKAIKLFFV